MLLRLSLHLGDLPLEAVELLVEAVSFGENSVSLSD
jgi:hypothetical protein